MNADEEVHLSAPGELTARVEVGAGGLARCPVGCVRFASHEDARTGCLKELLEPNRDVEVGILLSEARGALGAGEPAAVAGVDAYQPALEAGSVERLADVQEQGAPRLVVVGIVAHLLALGQVEGDLRAVGGDLEALYGEDGSVALELADTVMLEAGVVELHDESRGSKPLHHAEGDRRGEADADTGALLVAVGGDVGDLGLGG